MALIGFTEGVHELVVDSETPPLTPWQAIPT
jgi:hypothetical protein